MLSTYRLNSVVLIHVFCVALNRKITGLINSLYPKIHKKKILSEKSHSCNLRSRIEIYTIFVRFISSDSSRHFNTYHITLLHLKLSLFLKYFFLILDIDTSIAPYVFGIFVYIRN